VFRNACGDDEPDPTGERSSTESGNVVIKHPSNTEWQTYRAPFYSVPDPRSSVASSARVPHRVVDATVE
jgi:hypothetical protein